VTDTAMRPAPGTPRAFHFPAFDRRPLSNGMTIWLMPLEDRELVNVHLLFDSGAASEDEAHAGIAALTAQLLVTGTRRLDAAAFSETTERLGIEFSSQSGWDSARAAFQALPRFLDQGIGLLAEMVREPRLDAAEFDRLRAERLAEILQSRSEPGRLADEMFMRHLFAGSTPYSRLSAGTPETVEPLTVGDVRDFHRAGYLPGGAHLIVAGAIDPDEVMRAAEASFGDWSGVGSGHREIASLPAGGRRVVLVDRPGSVQSELRIGNIGIDRHDPRFFSATLMTTLLGGVFGSRLNIRLREELGYTYGAHASLDTRRSAGPLTARAAVQTEVTVPAVREMLAVLDNVRAAPPTEDELRAVRNFQVGVFPLRFETTGGLAAAIEPIAAYGLPGDWWSTYREHLEEVTAAEVHAAAEQLIRPDDLLVLVAGDTARVGADLEAAAIAPMEVAAAS
jgi:zinc protease